MDHLEFCGGIVKDWNLAGQKNSKLVVWDCAFRGVTFSVQERTLILLRRGKSFAGFTLLAEISPG